MPDTRVRRFKAPDAPEEGALQLNITSPAFEDGSPIPDRFSAGGGNVSPTLQWSALPEGTSTVAVICEDPDAPRAEPFTHWVLFDIPSRLSGIPERISKSPTPSEIPGAVQGSNDFGKVGYDGAAPPPGHGVHRYQFKVYALDVAISIPPRTTKIALKEAMKGHVLAFGELVGTYSRI